MGGDSRGFMGMGSLLGGAMAAQQSQHDLMNQLEQNAQMCSQKSFMASQDLAARDLALAERQARQQAAMAVQRQKMQAALFEYGQWPPSNSALTMKQLQEVYVKITGLTGDDYNVNAETVTRKSNIDKLRDEVRAWTRRAA